MKPLITRVLFATDFSHCAEQALNHALAIASSWKAELHILHVLEFLPGMNPDYPVNHMYLEQLRNEAAQDMVAIEKRVTQSGLPARATIEVGVPSQRIEALAAQTGASLIVMGTHGRTGFARIALGSVAEAVVRAAPCPVLTVHSAGCAIEVAARNGT